VGIVTHYVHWTGHNAAGTLPPLDVVAGVVRLGARCLPAWWSQPGLDEILVIVPAQWIGDWETGHTLAPAYQYLWRAPKAQLRPLLGFAEGTPYRPAELPASATGPRVRHHVSH